MTITHTNQIIHVLQFKSAFLLRITCDWNWNLDLLQIGRRQGNVLICQYGNSVLDFVAGSSEIFRCKNSLFVARVGALLAWQRPHHHQRYRSSSSLLVELASSLDERTVKSTHFRRGTAVAIVLHHRVHTVYIDQYSCGPIPKCLVLVDGINNNESITAKSKGMGFSNGTCGRCNTDRLSCRSYLAGFIVDGAFITSGGNDNDRVTNSGILQSLEDVGFLGWVA